MREKKRFLVLAGILFTISLLYVALTIAGNYTKTRLIQRKEDEVKAYYTAYILMERVKVARLL